MEKQQIQDINEKRLLDLFLELVSIESPSFSEADMAKRCKEELGSLGFSVREDESASITGSNTGNIIAHLEAYPTHAHEHGHVVLCAHMDTVVPCKNIEAHIQNGIISSKGNTILSADDKAGIAAICEAIRCCVEKDHAWPALTVILTTAEEQSLLGSGALACEDIPQGVDCYVLDADGSPGTIIVKSPCHYTLRATFFGKSAHAGVEPEKGKSAIAMAAWAITHMKLGRLDEESSANVGVIEGGSQVNIVAESCYLEGECRSFNHKKALECIEQINGALKEAAAIFGGRVEISWTKDYPEVNYDKNDPFIESIAKAAQSIGLTHEYRDSGGGADTNILLEKGARAVTLGIGMCKFHSCEEYISIEDLNNSARLALSLIRHHT